MVPARLAEKMSVMSVGTSPFSAHRTIAAERVHIAFTGPVRAASGAWRRPERPQGLPRAGRTARARGRGRVGAPPAHAAPGEGSAPGGWASDLPASLKYGGGPVLCSTGWRPGRAYQKFCPPRPMGKKGTRSLLLRCSSSKSTRRPPKSPIHSRESRKRGGAGSSRPRAVEVALVGREQEPRSQHGGIQAALPFA